MNAPTPTDSIQNKNCINDVSGIGAIPLSNYLLERTAVAHHSPKFSIFNLPTACRYISPTIYI